MKYRAVRNITQPGDQHVLAYAAGDLVHESSVDGDAAWLQLGPDVEPVPGADVPEPGKSAAHAAWAAFAVSKGAEPEQAAGASRADLIRKYATPAEAKAPAGG